MRADDPFTDLVTTLEGVVDQEAMLERALQDMRFVLLQQDPKVAAMEVELPGTLDKMIAAMRPVMQRHMEASVREHRQEMAALLRASLTPAEAADMANFYVSPLGRRLVQGASESYSLKATLSEYVRNDYEGDTTTDAVRRDTRAAVLPALAGLTDAERASLAQTFAKASWARKLTALQPKIMELQARATSRPMAPEIEAEMERAIMAVVEEAVAARQAD